MTTTRPVTDAAVERETSTGRPSAAAGRAPGEVRRVVTGHDEGGRSVLLADGTAPNAFRSASVPGLGSSVAWVTPAERAHNDGTADAAAGDVQVPMFPPPGGTIFRVADFPPDAAYDAERAADSLFADIGGQSARVEHGGSGHFWHHRTPTLDYGIVIEGEIWMLLDDGEVHLRAGDVVVQRGTSHAWSNRTDRACRMVFVLIGTPPLPDGGAEPGPSAP